MLLSKPNGRVQVCSRVGFFFVVCLSHRPIIETDSSGLQYDSGTINKQADSGQQDWNKKIAKKLKEYIQQHPDEFPSTHAKAAGVKEGELSFLFVC